MSVSPVIQTYTSVHSLPPSVLSYFKAHQRHTNVIYPLIKRLQRQELHGHRSSPDNVWITCSTPDSFSHKSPILDFVLSCTSGPQGQYPIFICTAIPHSELRDTYVRPRIIGLVRRLYETVPAERVYAVFSLESISRTFADLWTKLSGVPLDENPEYYSARLTYCTLKTLRIRPLIQPRCCKYILRQAVESDVSAAANLCYEFAAVSEPYTLTLKDAYQEAARLIRDNQLWVHEIIYPNDPPRITCIVAISRSSESVAAVTKVFTDVNSRNMGCAERLIRAVCDRLLKRYESVVLYVAYDNPSAAKAYHKVGFQGLNSPKTKADGAEDWLELGFDRNLVQLGHW